MKGNFLKIGQAANFILKTLDADCVKRLGLEQVTFLKGQRLQEVGETLRNLYFIEHGLASVMLNFDDGSTVGAQFIGVDGIVGIEGLLDQKHSLHRVEVEIAGSGYACSLESAQEESQRGAAFQEALYSVIRAQLHASLKLAGCMTKHEVRHRLARWLLECADKCGTGSLAMSHEALAVALGTRRSTISIFAKELKDQKLINYRRGLIEILDVRGLESIACECYVVTRTGRLKSHVHYP